MTILEARRLLAGGEYKRVADELVPGQAAGSNAEPEGHLLLGKALSRLGRHKEAAVHFDNALENDALKKGLSPREDTEAVITYVATLRSLGRYFAAARVLRGAADRHPKNHLFRALLALTEYKLGMYRESVEELTTLLVETSSSGEIQRFTSLLLHYAEGLQGWNRRDDGDTTYGRSTFA